MRKRQRTGRETAEYRERKRQRTERETGVLSEKP